MTTAQATPERSSIGTIALGAVLISALGLIGHVTGRLAGAKGFQGNSSTNTTLSYLCFFAFVLALLLAVTTGGFTWFIGRRSGRQADVRAGKTAVSYLLVAIVAAVVLNTVD